MEEKKLTDEEWFEAYSKKCKDYEDGYCEQLGCGGTADVDVEKEIEFDRRLISYVHRLQDENKRLSKKAVALEVETNNQKAEIERLTGVVNRLEMADKCGRRMRTVDQKKIAELQKQVDELKEKQVIECHGMLKGCDMVKQAVKDTAKEILREIGNIWNGEGKFEFRNSVWFKDLCKRYGVEVE